MMKTEEELFRILAKLKEDEFKDFKWFLGKDEILEGFSGISVAQLGKAERRDTVDLMVQKYQDPGALQLTMKVLEKINRNDLVQHLEESCSGPKEIEKAKRPDPVDLMVQKFQDPGALQLTCSGPKDSRSKPPTVFSNNEIRIVMVGKTGVGKSATGNTILGGKQCFKSEFSPKSLTEHCDKAYGEVDGQKVAVIDTPGLFDTSNTEEETTEDISQCISYACPGPHIFLVVIRLGRFTEEEKQTVQKIQKIFGEEADKYCMVLFTGGDLLKGKPIEEFLKDSKDLQELVAKCNNQYHVFNNEVEDRSQVSKLLKKIRNINEQNGGSYYTTEMFQKVEREREEEKQRILKEKEEQNRKEQEELRKEIEEKYQKQLREMEAEREKESKLRAAERKEIEEQLKKLKEEQEERARREAEKRSKIFKRINKFFKSNF